MKNIRELKKVLIRQIFSNPKRFIKGIEGSLEMGNAALWFLEDLSDEHYIQFIISKLCYEKRKLMETGIPVEKWPKQLRPENWSDEIWRSFGMEPPKIEPVAKTSSSQIKVEVPIPAVPEEFQPRLPKPPQKRIDDPAKSDSFGTLLGDTGDPHWDELHKYNRERR